MQLSLQVSSVSKPTNGHYYSKFARILFAGLHIIVLKAEKQKGVANKELLANLYQHLLEECLAAGAADMNGPNYCSVNSSTQIAGQFPSLLPVCLHNLQCLGQVSKSLETKSSVIKT